MIESVREFAKPEYGVDLLKLESPLAANSLPPRDGSAAAQAAQLPRSAAAAPVQRKVSDPGVIATGQRVSPAGLQSVNTITSTVQVQGAYQGSVPGTAAGAPLALSLEEAVRRGLQSNLGAIVNQQNVRLAQAIRTQERSALLRPAL